MEDGRNHFAEQREARLAFVMRWQQFTGPIVAKGLEDTTLYVYCPLISLNESAEIRGHRRRLRSSSIPSFESGSGDGPTN